MRGSQNSATFKANNPNHPVVTRGTQPKLRGSQATIDRKAISNLVRHASALSLLAAMCTHILPHVIVPDFPIWLYSEFSIRPLQAALIITSMFYFAFFGIALFALGIMVYIDTNSFARETMQTDDTCKCTYVCICNS